MKVLCINDKGFGDRNHPIYGGEYNVFAIYERLQKKWYELEDFPRLEGPNYTIEIDIWLSERFVIIDSEIDETEFVRNCNDNKVLCNLV